MKKILLCVGLFVFFSTAFGQRLPYVQEYIDNYGAIAIEEQLRTGVPAAIKMAQAIHESGAGKGDLALRSNNHFGIKCKTSWTGATAYHDDDERGECFRAYDSVAFSFRDHSDFLRANKRYASLFELDPADYKGWANGLKQAGYATNPKYPALIIRLIETYELNMLTELAVTILQNQKGKQHNLAVGSVLTSPPSANK
ncbi:MAG TPA: glucosaminidase domain-containing protein [Phnomibacter sp.]|nr:glucosaminidase domain-containing protein [Phnomibacter sp.]